ncbi:hypothetical protein D3C72_1749870 [compost metagenome]
MDAGFGGGFRDGNREMERCGAENGELAGEKSNERLLVADIDGRRRDGCMLLDLIQLLGAAVGDADVVIAGVREHASNGGADLACSDDDDVLHDFPPGYEMRFVPYYPAGSC